MRSEQPALTKGKIVVVDNQSDNLNFLCPILIAHGYKVNGFAMQESQILWSRPEAALPDLILLSGEQNEQNDDFVLKLKGDRQISQIPIILIEPSEHIIEKFQAAAIGVVDYINQPFRATEILVRIETQLQIQRLQRQLQQEKRDRSNLEQALQRVKEELRSSRERTNALLNAIPDKIFRHHIDGTFLDIKGQANDLIVQREAMIANNLWNLPIPEEVKANLMERICTAITTGQLQTYEHHLQKPDGIHIYESRFAKSGTDEAVCIVRDITERRQAETALQQANQELERLANLDSLTCIANRRRFDECLHQEWQRLAREQLPLALILCDIDYFKNYNDTYGHPAGDKCLQQVAAVLAASVSRPADLVARYGGEEFAILLPKTNIVGAAHVASQIRLAIIDLNICHDESQVAKCVTLSMGVTSIIPTAGSEPAILVTTADYALYQAKKEGRDRFYSIG